MRLWLAAPDWLFRVLGAGFFLGYVWVHAGEYRAFPRVGPWLRDGATVTFFPLAKVLFDLTFILIALSFIIRRAPLRRAARAREILLPLLVGFGPLMPFMTLGVLRASGSSAAHALEGLLAFGEISRARFYTGVTLLSVGLAIDVWAYLYLARSLSIVAEARALMTAGPYRLIRHPIYFGQFVSQAAAWLVLIDRREVWAAFYAAFVVLQLYRSRVEEQVLEDAFGEEYRAYRQHAWWFW